MDPISAGLSIVGMGMQLFGAMGESGVSKQMAQVSQNISQQEQGINQQKQLQMQLESRRSQLQTFRNAQRLRAQATAASVQGGSQFGSGLQGGLAGITDAATQTSLGINQATDIGTKIFGYNNAISADKAQLASLSGDMSTYQGLSGIGGMIAKNSGTLSGLAKDAGSFGSSLMGLMSPGSLSGGF